MRLRSVVVGLLILLCGVTDAGAQLRSRMRESQAVAPPTGGGGTGMHPLIWLDTATRALLSTKTGTQPYIAAIAAAGTLVSTGPPSMTITGATATNPVVFTIAEDVPFTTADVYIGRGRNLTGSGGGDWSQIDYWSSGMTGTGTILATKTGQHTFTVPKNGTGYGSFAGQTIAIFGRFIGAYSISGDGIQWGSDLFNLGFAYQMTGTPAYCTTAVAYLHYIAGLGVAGLTAPISIDSGYPARGFPGGMGLAYDWCYAFLAPQDKVDIDAAIYLWYQWYVSNGLAVDGPASENYFGGFVYGFGLAGIAMQETAHGPLVATGVRTRYNAIVEVAFADGGELQDGPILEGYTYGGSHWGRILQYLQAVKTSTGEDIASTSAMPAALGRNLFYSLKPNGWQFNDENDYAGDCTGIMDPNLIPQIEAPLVGHIDAQYLQYFYQHIGSDPFGGCTPPDNYAKMFWYNPALPATDYTVLPPIWFARGNAKQHWRTAWNNPNAVWASMLGQTAFNADLAHNNRLGGNIEFQRGSDFFLVNTNQFRDTNGVVGMPAFFNKGDGVGLNAYGNTLTHYDGGTYSFGGSHYEGGQAFWAPGGSANVRHQEQIADGWAYEKAFLQPAYCMQDYCTGSTCPGGIACHTMLDYARSVVFEGSGIGVVYDREVDRTTGYINKTVWQIHKQATISGPTGGVLTYTLGASQMFLKPMLPCGAAPTLTQSENIYDNGQGFGAYSFTHRLEVTDPAPTVNYRMVTVIAVAASGASAPTMTAICSTGNTMYGASVTDGALTYINLFSAAGTDSTTVTYAATCPGAGRHIVADLVPLTQFSITQGGTVISTRVSSSQGVVNFDSASCTGTFVVAPTTEVLQTPTVTPIRYAGFTAPGDGETLSTVGGLRLVLDGYDNNFSGASSGPCPNQHGANHIDVYANDTKVATLLRDTTCEFSTLKGRTATPLAVGTYAMWGRAVFEDGTYLDSPVRHITVDNPTCGVVVTLPTDLDVSGTAYVHSGSAGNYYCINGNGHSITGTPTSFLLDYVFAYNLGASTTGNGIDITTSGTVSITHSRFENSSTVAIVVNGIATETISDTVFASNSKFMLGQNPDQSDAVNGHGSYPFFYTAGSSNGAKVFKANQVGAGFMDVRSSQWTIGGTTAADGNVMQGPRVGIHLLTNAGQAAMLVSRNYIHHIYYGGWSQGDLLESGNTAGLTVEHNVLVGSSWPVRYLAGIFRYNLLDAYAGVEGLMWTEGGTPDIHHNVFRAPSIVSRGMIYMHGATTTATIRNNTFDMVDKNNIALDLASGTGTILNSNLFLHSGAPVIGGTVTANYNTFYDTVAGNVYNPNITPANDSTANPTLAGFTAVIPWNLGQAWTRTKTINQILADTRTAYTPTTGVIDNGDTATYGANNDRGAIGAGGANANDQF